jgi:hypothetical protein
LLSGSPHLWIQDTRKHNGELEVVDQLHKLSYSEINLQIVRLSLLVEIQSDPTIRHVKLLCPRIGKSADQLKKGTLCKDLS